MKGTIALKNEGHVLFMFHSGGVKTFVPRCSVALTPAPRERAVSSSLPKQRCQTASEKEEKQKEGGRLAVQPGGHFSFHLSGFDSQMDPNILRRRSDREASGSYSTTEISM